MVDAELLLAWAEWVASLSPERMALIEDRVLRAAGEDADLDTIFIVFMAISTDMMVKDEYASMVEDGLIKPTEVFDNGEVGYSLVEEDE